MSDDNKFISDEDRDLWYSFIENIKKVRLIASPPPVSHSHKPKSPKSKNTFQAKLDLHGMTQERAYSALVEFINVSFGHRYKCVLVITGKGREPTFEEWWARTPGVLKREVPKWLASPILHNKVKNIAPAALKDGGEGAIYVYLK